MTREEAKQYIIQHCNPDYPNGNTEGETAMKMAIKALQPSEIIRCKDCKFYIPMSRKTNSGICSLITHPNFDFGDDWYCAGAERRTSKRSD